ncbi:SIMPL domain-containing protein [Veillonella sp.]|uniref:SIMPL domain-containing protein n=2 Tax=Veillonella sp. TaxID=1926307 RepID=UPI001B54F786|nr:SIMPL domain-containing protein [Veillonella sp.]MBP8617363.1 SIMPL domain-containing protein [Veillonella sp.]NCB96289.1 DUF541 domain-containing protein [Negativicutes bacterium]
MILNNLKKLAAVTSITAICLVTPNIALADGMQPSEIHTSGSASRTMAPTYATLSLGITTTDGSVNTAKMANDRVMSNIIANLAGLGVAKKDIYTSNISINPQYNYDNGKRISQGYTITNTVSIKINDLDKVGPVINTAVNSGATDIHSLNFESDVSQQLSDSLTTEAISNGRHKAEVMAAALGRTLGPVKSVSLMSTQTSSLDENYGSPRLYKAMAISSSTPVEKGTLIVSQDADIVYYLQ